MPTLERMFLKLPEHLLRQKADSILVAWRDEDTGETVVTWMPRDDTDEAHETLAETIDSAWRILDDFTSCHCEGETCMCECEECE